MKKNTIITSLIIVGIIISILLFGIVFYYMFFKNTEENNTKEIPTNQESIKTNEVNKKDILISAIGDCTLGTDINFGYDGSLPDIFNKNGKDYSYFFSKSIDIFKNDDLSIANMEGTFTTSNERADKVFAFKGDPDYAKIFTAGSIEAVNLANNHTADYGKQGYNDTLEALDKENIKYFGSDKYYIYEIKGIKIGLAGFTYIETDTESNTKAKTDSAIEYFRNNNTDLIFITYHWGIEKELQQNEVQEKMGRYAIDKGADLIIGHGPHRLQGIEEYNGKYIVYSLSNYVFGGHKNPSAKDTIIYQEKFQFEDNKLVNTSIKIIPAQMSGLSNKNDYRPIIFEGEEKQRVLDRVLSVSNIKYKEETE